jgi:transposase
MQKNDGRHKSKEAQKEIRMLTIEHWRKNGNMQEAARVFGVSYPAVRKWVKKFQAEGSTILVEDRRGRPTGKELSMRQEKAIISKISSKQPEQLKLTFGLWTRENVAELILREFGIKRSIRQVGRYLKEWGFTPQKPVYKAYEQNSEEVQKWLRVQYPSIKRRAKAQRATIFWGDETGVRSHDQRGRSFSMKGQTPVILKTSKRFGVNMISAVSNRGKLHFMIYKGGINSDKFTQFLKRLKKSVKGKIFLIVDNLPAHKTNKVKEWLENEGRKITLFYLPVYSPELNPDEYLNQDLKANIVGKVKMNSQHDLKDGIVKFLNKRKRDPNQIKKYFKHPRVKYAA